MLAVGTVKIVLIGVLAAVLVVVIAALSISERKRKEKARERALQRRKQREAMLAKAKEKQSAFYRNEVEDAADRKEQESSEEESKTEKLSAEEASAKESEELFNESLFSTSNEQFWEAADSETEEAAAKEEKKDRPASKLAPMVWMLGAAGVLALVALIAVVFLKPGVEEIAQRSEGFIAGLPDGASESDASQNQDGETQGDPESSQVQEPVSQEMQNGFSESPRAVAQTEPSAWGMNWEIFTGDAAVSTYQRPESIDFQGPSGYFALPGIATFRGNNYRNGGSYGTVTLNEKRFGEPLWSQATGSISTSDGDSSWTGSGWTGQPLIVQWDAQTRRNMNLYESKKNKENLVEVIYATLGGTIYFIDLEDGDYTRDPLDIGMTFKGAGALDPRGYPLMYVGSGDYTVEGVAPKMFIISLIDGSVLYTYGDYDPIAMRSWCAFDSSPLVDAETDTLIWPGENGVFYTIKLNSVYDAAAGTVSISPEQTVRTRYASARSNDSTYWLGYECSVSIMDHYAYLSENGGMFYCIDLNTMQLVWAQDTKDDSNSTPVAEYEAVTGKGYIYTAPSLHWTAEGGWGSIPICKLDALTGEMVWKKEYECGTVDGVSGGVQATPVLGRAGSNIENLIIYPIARTPDLWGGAMVALNKETGEEVWRWDMDAYVWSSPVAVYTEEEKGYLIAFDSAGYGYLLDGETGTVLDTINVGSLVEATPAVYGNTVVIGTRGLQIYGLQLK